MSSRPQRADGQRDDGTVSRYCLLYLGEEYPLHDGDYYIGRHANCDLNVNDPLVSRRHARLVVTPRHVVIQDLDSENGVFVNERRIDEPVRLEDGDRILVGTHEMSLFLRSREVEPAPESGASDALSAIQRASLPPQLQKQSGNSTLQADAFVYLGRVADRMLSTSRPHAAERILGGHLRDVSEAARRGKSIDDELLDAAAQYALKLGRALREPAWVDYAVELHLLCDRPMQPLSLQSFRLLFNRIPRTNGQLLRQYQERLLSLRSSLSRAEQRWVDQIVGLEPAED